MGLTARVPACTGPGALLLATILGCQAQTAPDPAYVAEIEQYRADRIQRLRQPDGWLTLIGLFWLEPGETAFGSAESNPIRLPDDAAPPVAGRFHYDGTSVRMVAEPGVEITVDGEAVREVVFDARDDRLPPEPSLGRLRILVIERDGRHAVRIKDPEHPARKQFTGIEFYPIRPEYRVKAKLAAFDEPRSIEVATVLDSKARFLVPGTLEFELDGVPLTLEPLIGDPSDTQLFLIFKDDTSGKETYGAGRYLYVELEPDGVEIDFNRAYNPPCAFTAFATCPLPPPQNRLPVPILAGEKAYH